MLKIAHLIIAISALCLPMASPVEAGLWQSLKEVIWGKEAPPPTIKVLISHDQPNVAVEVKGAYELYDPRTNERISSHFFGKGQYFRSVSGGLKWGEEFPGIYQLKIVPDEEAVLFVNGKPYQGVLYVYDVNSGISLVNELPIEDYLEATLTGSFGGALPEEALAAVAIVARTWTTFMAKHPKSRFWAIEASKVGYEGSSTTTKGSPMQRAIYATRHMVMSRTTAYEKIITPFAAQWEKTAEAKDTVPARLTLGEAEALAKKGDNAAQILHKAFPGAFIALSYP